MVGMVTRTHWPFFSLPWDWGLWSISLTHSFPNISMLDEKHTHRDLAVKALSPGIATSFTIRGIMFSSGLCYWNLSKSMLFVRCNLKGRNLSGYAASKYPPEFPTSYGFSCFSLGFVCFSSESPQCPGWLPGCHSSRLILSQKESRTGPDRLQGFFPYSGCLLETVCCPYSNCPYDQRPCVRSVCLTVQMHGSEFVFQLGSEHSVEIQLSWCRPQSCSLLPQLFEFCFIYLFSYLYL